MKKMIVTVLILLALVITPAAFAQETEPITMRSAPPDGSSYRLVELVGGFTRPLYATHAGDGSNRLFIVEQVGRIRVFQNGQLLDTPFLDISSLITTRGNEQGLLGLAFHPDYQENGQFFVNYTNTSGDTVIARYQVSGNDPNLADPDSAAILLQVDQPFPNHNGGDVVFGPDGYLYIGMGDGGSAGDPQGNGQNPQALLGKILRIDVDGGQPYGIPPDNPYQNNPALAPEVWALGVRNPWRFTFDRATGDLYIADVGQNAWEEVNFQLAASPGGENYGWNIMEGTHRYSGAAASADLVMPFTEYPHSEGCSVTGGYVYRGQNLPDLQGVYLFSDYCFGTIWASYRDPSGQWQRSVFMDTRHTVSSFAEDEQGELYVIDHAGAIYSLQAAQ